MLPQTRMSGNRSAVGCGRCKSDAGHGAIRLRWPASAGRPAGRAAERDGAIMVRMLEFSEGEVLLDEGSEETVAYLIREGWLEVRRERHGVVTVFTLGPGEIVGELGLTGLARSRTATVAALTDGVVEVIDRGALIRMVNGPGDRLVPLLAALLSRLRDALVDEQELDDTMMMHARLEGLNDKSRRALCNRPRMITHLPWVFGAWRGPASVTDLFRPRERVDVRLGGDERMIRPCHVQIESDEEGGLQVRLMNHGDWCELDGARIGHGAAPCVAPLGVGEHELAFGQEGAPWRFGIRVPA